MGNETVTEKQAARVEAPGVGMRLTPKQEARRDRIVRAAIELAADGGYEAVQMRDVATRSNVALGTLYRYFASKDNLLLAAHAEWVNELRRRLEERPPKGDTPVERLVSVIRRAVRAFEREPRLAEAMVLARLSSEKATRKSRLEANQTMHQILRSAMTGAKPEDQEDVIWLLGQVWFANLVHWVSGVTDTTQMGQDLERLARMILDDRPPGNAANAR